MSVNRIRKMVSFKLGKETDLQTMIYYHCYYWKPQNKELYNFVHRVKNLIRRISKVKPFSVSEDQMDVTKVQPARVSNTNGCAHGKVASYFST